VPYETGTASDLEQTAAAIAELGAASLAIAADVTSEVEVEAMIAAVIERFGRLDVLVKQRRRDLRRPRLGADRGPVGCGRRRRPQGPVPLAPSTPPAT